MKTVSKVKSKGTPKAGSTVGVNGDNKAKKVSNYVDQSVLKAGQDHKWNHDYPDNTGAHVDTNMLNVKTTVSVNGDNYAK